MAISSAGPLNPQAALALAVARASGSIDIMSSADGAIAVSLPPAAVAGSGPHAGTKEGTVIRSMHFLPSTGCALFCRLSFC